MTVLRRLLGVVVGLAALGVLVVGIPVLLVGGVGWPLPSQPPSIDALTTAVENGSSVADGTVLKVIACVVWVVWAQFVAAVAVEAVATVRGRRAGRVRVVPGGVQHTARWLVALIVVAGSVSSGRALPASAGGFDPVPAAAPPVTGAAVATPAPTTLASVASPAAVSWTVERDHTLWSIAEAALGDGHRWVEVLDVNRDRITDPNVLHTGQVLRLPAGAAVSPPAPASGRVVVPGDTLSGIAEDELGAANRWGELWESTRGDVQSDGRTMSDPDLIHPGWVIDIPVGPGAVPAPTAPVVVEEIEVEDPALEVEGPALEVDGPGPVDAPAPPVTTGPSAPSVPESGAEGGTTPLTVPSPPSGAAPSSSVPSRPSAPAGDGAPAAEGAAASTSDGVASGPVGWGALGVAGALLGTGVVRARRHRRLRRSAVTPADMVPPGGPVEAGDVYREAVRRTDEASTDFLDAALRRLGAVLRPRAGRDCPLPRLVQVDGDRVEVLWAEAVLPAASGWRPEASGSVWVLDSDPGPVDELVAPMPALVTIGRTDDGATLIDVEAAGVVAITGDRVAGEALARAVVLELAARPVGDGVALRVVGATLTGGDRVSPGPVLEVSSWAEVADDVGVWVRESSGALAAAGWPHTFAARASGRSGDGWAPLVVVAAEASPTVDVDELAGRVRPGGGVAVVVVCDSAPVGATEIRVDAAGGYEISGLGLSGEVQAVSAATAELLAVSVESVDGPSEQLLFAIEEVDDDEPVVDQGEVPEQRPAKALNGHAGRRDGGDVYQDPGFDVMVSVLGDIAVRGGSRRLTPRETALLAYVALTATEAPVRIERAAEALWAGTARADKTVRNLSDAVRNKVGLAVMPHVREGRFVRGPRLRSDLELLQRRVAYARTQEPAAAVVTLRGGLELVDGDQVCTPPRTGREYFGWVDVDNWEEHAKAAVATAARDLGEICLGLGDAEGAVWAAEQGLVVSEARLEVVSVLVRAHALAGDDAALEAACRRYGAEVGALDFETLPASAERIIDLLDELRERPHAGTG